MGWSRFFRRARWDHERASELQAYLDIETDENIARGLTPEQARDAARRKLGNTSLVREEVYRMNTVTLLDSLWNDLRHGARLLRLNPGFTIVAVTSLALGIGANTAIFQLLDAVRLRTLPVERPQELAQVRIENRRWGSGSFNGRNPALTNPLWEYIRDHQEPFSSMLAYGDDTFNLTAGGQVRFAQALYVSGDFFSTLGVRPLVGRTITKEDDRRGCGVNVVISYAFWQREFGGDGSVLGRKLTLDGHPAEIIGVTPPEFYGIEVGRSFDLATPVCSEAVLRGENVRLDKRDSWWLGAVGRLKPGWTVDSAAAYFRAQSDNILKANIPPTYNSDAVTNYLKYRFAAVDAGKGISSLRGRYSTPLQLLLAIAGLVLLIACANLANLMLARASAREREIAVRLAIGASRARLVRQLLSESLLLALTGALLGAALAQVLSQTLVSFLSTRDNPAFVDLHFDWRILGFAAALAILTCTLFGLTPALRATQGQPSSAMRVGGRGLTSSRERLGLRRGLVVLQVGLSLVLLVGALLFVRSFSKLANLDAGFRQEGLLVTSLDYSPLSVARERRLAFTDDLLQRVRGVPGVDSAALTGVVPLTNNNWNQTLNPDSESTKTDRNTHISNVSQGYFQTMAIPIVAGRDFDSRDSAGAPKAAIVNEIFVRQFLKPGNPIGKTFQLQRPPGQPEPIYTIVGMVKDTKYSDLHDDIEPIAFLPISQDEKPDQSAQIMVRSNAELVGLVSSLKRVLAEVSPSIVVDFQVFRTQVRESLLRERLMATLSGFFGGLAVLLAVIGLYGVMSYIVARRRSEIGIRIALGASRTEVIRMIMQEAGWLLAVGIVVGTALALALGRTAETLLFGLKPNDPATIAFSIAALAVVAVAASYLPALRAAAVEPMTALREE